MTTWRELVAWLDLLPGVPFSWRAVFLACRFPGVSWWPASAPRLPDLIQSKRLHRDTVTPCEAVSLGAAASVTVRRELVAWPDLLPWRELVASVSTSTA